jgi:uncharacterized damage-inducible protein DinB
MIQELRVNGTELLLRWFDQQRAHAIGILDGLSDEELRRPVLQSGWSCLGMIGHLEGLERFWFRHVVLGDVSATSAVPQDIEWQVDPAVPAAAVFASYRSEIARSNEIIRATPLDAPPAWWPDFFGEWRLHNLWEILLHTMTETGTHAGHLDAARELIDGRQWYVLEV